MSNNSSETLDSFFSALVIPVQIWERRDISLKAKCFWGETIRIYGQTGWHEKDEKITKFLLKFFCIKKGKFKKILNQLMEAGLISYDAETGRYTPIGGC
jgi:hypothetical protein